MEDNKQLILEGQHHVALNTVGKEALSFPQKQVMQCEVLLQLLLSHKRLDIFSCKRITLVDFVESIIRYYN